MYNGVYKLNRCHNKPGSLVVCGEEKGNMNGEGLVDLEDIGKELEDGVVVLLEENVEDDTAEVRSFFDVLNSLFRN